VSRPSTCELDTEVARATIGAVDLIRLGRDHRLYKWEPSRIFRSAARIQPELLRTAAVHHQVIVAARLYAARAATV